MNHSDSIVKLAAALTKAQAELKSAPFNKKNPFLNNRPYADLGSHIDTAKPVLAKHGLAVSQLVTSDSEGKIGVETVLLHESGEWISALVMLPPSEEKGKSSAQVAGSIISYFRRYSLAAILGMYSDEEDDGAGSQPGTQATGTKAPAQQEKAPAPAGANGKPAQPPALKDTDVATAGSVPMVKYAEICAQAEKVGVKPAAVVPGKTTVGDLRKMYADVQAKIEAAQQPAVV